VEASWDSRGKVEEESGSQREEGAVSVLQTDSAMESVVARLHRWERLVAVWPAIVGRSWAGRNERRGDVGVERGGDGGWSHGLRKGSKDSSVSRDTDGLPEASAGSASPNGR